MKAEKQTVPVVPVKNKATCDQIDTVVHIFKAQQTTIENQVPNASIEIIRTLPVIESTGDARPSFQDDAKTLAEVLWSSLPGGTLDALLIEMLDRKRNLLVVVP